MKKFLALILGLVLLVSLAGCDFASYEDTNGDSDYTLQHITEEDIISGTGFITVGTLTTTVNNTTTCKAQKLSGVTEIYSATLKEKDLTITLSNKIIKGNAQLSLVVNDEIVHTFALNSEETFSIENVSGSVDLKVAGEEAQYEITYTID